MPTTKEAAAAAAATAANDALAGQAAVAAQQAILARQAAAAVSQRAEFTYLAGLAPNRRTVAQNTRLAVFMGNAPRTQHAGPTALHALSLAVQVTEVPRGGTIYRMNDQSDGFYVVVDGRVILYDVKDKDEAEEDDGVVDRLGRLDSFGEEDLLSNSRRAHRADVGPDSSALLIRVPPELYRKYLQHLHQPDFEDKVEFLSHLEVFRSLPDETLRKLAPCFAQVELRAREYLVRQGERAESMYAIASGQCSVLVDPAFRMEPGAEPETDPKKAMQVCLIGPGNIVGDMTVLANVRRRTATILCLTDLVCYKIRRATFIRRVPSIQLEALRQVAEAKLRITERHMQSSVSGTGSTAPSGKGAASLRDKLLRGHDLRQLLPRPIVPHLELRGLAPGLHNEEVQRLIPNSLLVLATSASGAGVRGGGSSSSGGPGSVATAAASGSAIGGNAYILQPPGSVLPLQRSAAATAAATAAAAAAAAMAATTAEARLRFGAGRKNSGLSPRSRALVQMALATSNVLGGSSNDGGAGSALADRPGATIAKLYGRSGASPAVQMQSCDKLRNAEHADINFSWGLGPGTLINSLLEKPPADSGITLHRVYAADARDADTNAVQQDSSSGGSGGGGRSVTGGGVPPSASSALTQLLPSAAAPQLRPSSSRQHIQHLSFNYGRSGGGFGGPGLRGSSSTSTLPQPRWGWTSSPIDASYSPYTAPSSFGTTSGGTGFGVVGISVNNLGAPDGHANSGGGGGGVSGSCSFSNAGFAGGGALVLGLGLRRGGVHSAHNTNGASLPCINGEKMLMTQVPNHVGRRSFSGSYTASCGSVGGGPQYMGLQRPGPLVLGPAAPTDLPPPQQPSLHPNASMMQLLQPGLLGQSSPSSSQFQSCTTQRPTSAQQAQKQTLTQQLEQRQQEQHLQRSGRKRGSGSGNGDAARLGSSKTGLAEANGDGFSSGAATSTAPSHEAMNSPVSNVDSPARSRYSDASFQQDLRRANGHISRGASVKMIQGASGVFASSEEEVGSDGDCLTPVRREPVRRNKSMGKARFGRQMVTQNSSVDALVVEVIIKAMAKDLLLTETREEEAIASFKGAEEVVENGESHVADAPAAITDGTDMSTEAGTVSGATADETGGIPTSYEEALFETVPASDGNVGQIGEGLLETSSASGTAVVTDGAVDGGDRTVGEGTSAYNGGQGESSSAVGGVEVAHESPDGRTSMPGTEKMSGDKASPDEVEISGAQAAEGNTPTAAGDATSASAVEGEPDSVAGHTASEAVEGSPGASGTSKSLEESAGGVDTSRQDTLEDAAVEAGDSTDAAEAKPAGPAEPDAADAARQLFHPQAEEYAAQPDSGKTASELPPSASAEGNTGGGNEQTPDASSFPILKGRESLAMSEGSTASVDGGLPRALVALEEQQQRPPVGDVEAAEAEALKLRPSGQTSQAASDSPRSMSGVFATAGGNAAVAIAAAAEGEAAGTQQAAQEAQPHGHAAVSPRTPSGQAITLQMTLMDATAQTRPGSSVSPTRRQVGPHAAPRPYPYVGTFLSLKKGPPLPVNFMPPPPLPLTSAAASKTLSFTLRGSSPAFQATGVVALPLPAATPTSAPGGPPFGGGASTTPNPAAAVATQPAAAAAAPVHGHGDRHVGWESRQGKVLVRSTTTDGLHGMNALVGVGGRGGGAGGFHAGGGSSGTRGQLRRGGALYRTSASSRNGSVV